MVSLKFWKPKPKPKVSPPSSTLLTPTKSASDPTSKISPSIPITTSGGGSGGSTSLPQAQGRGTDAERLARSRAAEQAAIQARTTQAKIQRELERRAIIREQRRRGTVVQRGGGVRVGRTTYHGSSKVPGTGKTANQLQAEKFKEARKKYGSGIKRGETEGIIVAEGTTPSFKLKSQMKDSKVYTLEQSKEKPEMTYKIDFGSPYQNIDKHLKGFLPMGVSPAQVKEADKTAKQLIKEGLPTGKTYAETNITGSYALEFKEKEPSKLNLSNVISSTFSPGEVIESREGLYVPKIYGLNAPATDLKDIGRNVRNVVTYPFVAYSKDADRTSQELIASENKALRGAGYTIGATGIFAKGMGGSVGSAALSIGTLKLYQVGSPLIRTGLSGYASYSGIKTAVSPDYTPQERIVGGVIGTLGTTGVIYETSPYIKGIMARFSPKYKPVVTEGKVQTIYNIKGKKNIDLRLIPSGDKATGNVPAFKSTAYGFSRKYQSRYIGKQGDVVTSARDLVKFQNKIGKAIEITPGDEGYGLFGTPYDLGTGATQTRVSRLGIASNWKEFIFGTKSDSSGFSFRLTRESPQFVVFEKSKITATGGKGTFKAFGKVSSELEVTALGKVGGIKKVGVTTIGGQKVDIFSAKLLGGGEGLTPNINQLNTGTSSLTSTSSLYGALSSLGLYKKSATKEISSKPLTPSSSLPSVKYTSPPSMSLSKIYSGGSKTSKGTSISSPHYISPPPTIKVPPYSPSRSPKVLTPSRPPSKPPYRSPPITPPPKTPKALPFLKSKPKKLKLTTKTIPVYGRRFGKFKQIGSARSERQALKLGKGWATKTLGATFYVPKAKKVKIPNFYTKETKKGIIYIEKAPKRLKKGTQEVPEIKLYKKTRKK